MLVGRLKDIHANEGDTEAEATNNFPIHRDSVLQAIIEEDEGASTESLHSLYIKKFGNALKVYGNRPSV